MMQLHGPLFPILDLKDRRILFELDVNARRSDSEIAKKVSLSKEVVNYRIKKLTEMSIIEGFYTMIDFSKLGFLNIRVYLKLQEISPEEEKELLQYLVRNKNTFEVIKADGNWDMVFTILVRNLGEFFYMWEQFELKYKKYINEKNVCLFYQYTHYPRNYFIDKPNLEYSGLATGGSHEIKIDKIDWQILEQLAVNAKISLVDLAKKIKLTPEAVKYRIKQLEKNQIILGYKTKINLSLLGYKFFKVDIELKNVGLKKELRQFARQHPNIIAEDIALGGSDYEFDVEAMHYEHFINLLTDIRERFKDNIRTIRYYIATKFYKISYLPQELRTQ